MIDDVILKKQGELPSKENNLLAELHDAQAVIDELYAANNELLCDLHQVQAALDYNYRKKISLENTNRRKKYYGAAKRIKNQLSYRLGSILIINSKSISGVLSMPFSLFVAYIQYKEYNRLIDDLKFPAIKSYADYYEVEGIKKHLSFNLGQNILKTLREPFGIIKLPYVIYKTNQNYKKEQNK